MIPLEFIEMWVYQMAIMRSVIGSSLEYAK